MRSKQQNNEWYNRASGQRDGISRLGPPVPPELARRIWEHENGLLDDFRETMLDHIKDQKSLRKYLGFESMDVGLWSTLSILIHSLLERDDITNLDTVINRIVAFVKLCPHFHELRFLPMDAKAKETNPVL